MARNYGQLQTAVQKLVIDLPQDTQDEIPNYVNRAARVAQEAHNWNAFMKATQTSTTVVGASTIALPSDFKQVRANPVYRTDLGDDEPMQWLNSDDEIKYHCTNDSDSDIGSPRWLTVDEENQVYRLCPWPDGASDHSDGEYRLRIPYWKFLPALVDPGDTNWLTTNAEWFLIWGAAAEAHAFNVWDEKAQTWTAKANAELARLTRMDKMRNFPRRVTIPFSGGALGAMQRSR